MIDYDNRAGLKMVFSFRGTVIKQVLFPILLFTAITAGIVFIDLHYFEIKANPAPWAIVGTALGLLMVFRTNTAYDRYWEGRKLFGALVSTSRNVVLNLLAVMDPDDPDSIHLVRTISELLMAFNETVKQRLQDDHNLEEVVDHLSVLSDSESKVLHQSKHIPLSIMLIVRNIIYRDAVPRMLTRDSIIPLENMLTSMVDQMGGLDRIRRTPMPFAYVVHLKSLLTVFILTLPIGLVDGLGWWSCLVIAITTYGLFGIEEIGVEIEDPFGDDPNDLPLDGICESLHKNLNDLLAEQETL